MNELKSLLHYALLCVLMILTSLSLAIVSTIYLSSYIFALFSRWFDYPSLTGLTLEQLQTSYRSIIHYFFQPEQVELIIPNFSMSAGGIEHFSDVRQLVWLSFVIGLLALIALVVIGVTKGRVSRRLYISWLRLGQYLPLGLLFGLLLGFDYLFIRFHELFFSNDLWIFDPLLDPIITVLPQSFFLVLFVLCILLYEVYLWLIAHWSTR